MESKDKKVKAIRCWLQTTKNREQYLSKSRENKIMYTNTQTHPNTDNPFSVTRAKLFKFMNVTDADETVKCLIIIFIYLMIYLYT